MPLNIDIFLKNSDGELPGQEKLEGSSKLSKENEMMFEKRKVRVIR